MCALAGASRWVELSAELRDLALEPSALPLRRLADHGAALAERTGRIVKIDVDDAGIRLDPQRWSALWSVLVHVVRNAVIHGIGEGAQGHVELRTRRDAGDVIIEVADDGGGIAWDLLAARDTSPDASPSRDGRPRPADRLEVDAHLGRRVRRTWHRPRRRCELL